jgi:hypothetical protein
MDALDRMKASFANEVSESSRGKGEVTVDKPEYEPRSSKVCSQRNPLQPAVPAILGLLSNIIS